MAVEAAFKYLQRAAQRRLRNRSSAFRRATSGRRFYNPSTGRWLNRDPIEEVGGRNLYAFVANGGPKRIDGIGLSGADTYHELNLAIEFGCSYCTNQCSPDSPPRIDTIESIILPSSFQSPEMVKHYQDFVAGLNGLSLVAGITPSSVLMTAIETTYNLTSQDMQKTFTAAQEAFTGNAAFVRLRTRIQYSTCELRRCLLLWKRYEWVTHPDSPTKWREHVVGMDPEIGYLGFSDAEDHVLEAQQAHAKEFNQTHPH